VRVDSDGMLESDREVNMEKNPHPSKIASRIIATVLSLALLLFSLFVVTSNAFATSNVTDAIPMDSPTPAPTTPTPATSPCPTANHSYTCLIPTSTTPTDTPTDTPTPTPHHKKTVGAKATGEQQQPSELQVKRGRLRAYGESESA
jgi:hypothetical protein